MRFQDTFFSSAERFSLGVETDSGQHYLAIPVSNGLVDYEEYYGIPERRYRRFLAEPAAAAQFARSCRQHERDELLIQPPGGNRGIPV